MEAVHGKAFGQFAEQWQLCAFGRDRENESIAVPIMDGVHGRGRKGRGGTRSARRNGLVIAPLTS